MVIKDLNSFYQTSINHVNQVALSLATVTANIKIPYEQYLANLQGNTKYQEFTKAFIQLRADIESYSKDHKKAMDDQRFLNKATMDRIENSLIKAATKEYKQT
jgi:predicted DNA-binding helix-hairpin-helix protein